MKPLIRLHENASWFTPFEVTYASKTNSVMLRINYEMIFINPAVNPAKNWVIYCIKLMYTNQMAVIATWKLTINNT